MEELEQANQQLSENVTDYQSQLQTKEQQIQQISTEKNKLQTELLQKEREVQEEKDMFQQKLLKIETLEQQIKQYV